MNLKLTELINEAELDAQLDCWEWRTGRPLGGLEQIEPTEFGHLTPAQIRTLRAADHIRVPVDFFSFQSQVIVWSGAVAASLLVLVSLL